MLKKLKLLAPLSLRMRYHAFKKWLHRIFILGPRVARMRKQDTIKILFIAYTPAMWKIDSFYQAVKAHPQLEGEILIVPHMGIKDEEQRYKEIQYLKAFFKEKKYEYNEWSNIKGECIYNKIPDRYNILVYPQGYPGIAPENFDFSNNSDKLLIDSEYAFHSGNQDWAFNKWYQNEAWLDLYENECTYRLSKKRKNNRGINSIVTGLPFMDAYRKETYTSPWKKQKEFCKKIIWAPHWTISDNSGLLPCYSNFLEMADYMLKFAIASKDRFQFAFKPHPRLKLELYNHEAWGKDRTNKYYEMWENGENTQLEEGEYVDLFMTSDALIHDSSSFCCEYMYTGKPILFMAKNEKKQVILLNEMAYNAFYNQYIGKNIKDIESFIENQIIRQDDPLKEKRENFVLKYLTPPNKRSAAENIIAAILNKKN